MGSSLRKEVIPVEQLARSRSNIQKSNISVAQENLKELCVRACCSSSETFSVILVWGTKQMRGLGFWSDKTSTVKTGSG